MIAAGRRELECSRIEIESTRVSYNKFSKMSNSHVDALIRLHTQVMEMRVMITEFNEDENPSDIRFFADYLTRLRNKLTNFLKFTREDTPSVEVTLHRTKLYTIEAQLTDTVEQIIDMAYTLKYDAKSCKQTTCAVCLSDFEINELVQKMMFCEHIFHAPCVKEWLKLNTSCPLCRR
uniref:RING-type domain-containing protein n=1 Tax=Glossina palpalis gambiensis TaxID=67801 RepID=A0A1B0BTK0_9MUSC